MAADEIRFVLSKDEALVLFELLHRWEDAGGVGDPDRGEQVALWAISGALERVLTAPFDADYLAQVDAARRRLAGKQGG